MSSSTRSRLLVLVAVLLVVLGLREREIRRHAADVDEWPRRNAA